MSQTDRAVDNVEAFFPPVSHYDSPAGVLNDARLSTDEKRVILSSWASDMYVVESRPALREIPGIPHRLEASPARSQVSMSPETDGLPSWIMPAERSAEL
jgi:hypothetical protein